MALSGNSLGIEETYSPIDSYKNLYRELHNENIISLFNEMVKKSQIDVAANRKTNLKITENSEQTANNKKSINRKRGLKVFAILLLIISIVAIIYNAVQINSSYSSELFVYVIIIAIVFIVLSILIIKKCKEKLSMLQDIENELNRISQKLHAEAEEQMRSLNSFLFKNYNTELFSKTIPLVKFDQVFDNKRLAYMKEKYRFDACEHEESDEQSTLFVQSGEIKGNPFFIRENIIHKMGTKTYSGSKTIHWSTQERDNTGNYRTVHHSETLNASVVKPCPYYSTSSNLVYANEIGDRLSFSRNPSHIHQLNKREVERLIKDRSKNLQNFAEESIREGGSFTALGNNEFDAIFFAKDRNNEQQFRLLFTPLAQKELIKMFKDNEVGYGDDFSFFKSEMINYIYPEHLMNTNFNVPQNYFVGINYDEVRQRFIDYHTHYFKHIFFTFAPIFSIPAYVQHQTQEYIYKDLYEGFVNFYQHEMTANNMNSDDIIPSDSVTRNIIKTSLISSQGDVDSVAVRAWGYKTIERTDYVSERGRDGYWHDVPVHWEEYILVERQSTMEITLNDDSEDNDETISNNHWIRLGRILARTVK